MTSIGIPRFIHCEVWIIGTWNFSVGWICCALTADIFKILKENKKD